MFHVTFRCAARTALVLLSIVALTGCTRDRYEVPMILMSDKSVIGSRDDSVPWVAEWEGPGNRSLRYEVLNPYKYGPGSQSSAAIQPSQPNGTTVPPTTQEAQSYYQIASSRVRFAGISPEQARNQLQSAIIRISNKAVSSHLASLKVSESFWNNSLGFSTLGLAAAATATTGGVATGLAAGATVTSGTRSLVNEQEFRNALVESIILLIEKDREKELDRITLLQAFPIDKYNVEQAIADATSYHSRGSFYHGLALLAEAARKSGNDVEQSTALFVRSKAELARLIGLENGLANFDKFIAAAGNGQTKPNTSEWFKTATPEQVAVALSYMRSTTFIDTAAARKRALDQEKSFLNEQERLASVSKKEAEDAAKRVEDEIVSTEKSLAEANKSLTEAESTIQSSKEATKKAEERKEAIKEQFDKGNADAVSENINLTTSIRGYESAIKSATDLLPQIRENVDNLKKQLASQQTKAQTLRAAASAKATELAGISTRLQQIREEIDRINLESQEKKPSQSDPK